MVSCPEPEGGREKGWEEAEAPARTSLHSPPTIYRRAFLPWVGCGFTRVASFSLLRPRDPHVCPVFFFIINDQSQQYCVNKHPQE